MKTSQAQRGMPRPDTVIASLAFAHVLVLPIRPLDLRGNLLLRCP